MSRQRRSWRRPAAAWLLVLGLYGLLPEAASAQPSALFPDLYIHRQRSCAANEDPRYQYYRENYFGYFPTCWRRFPDSRRWNCPNPEAPNWEEALRKLPLEVPPNLGAETGEQPGGTLPGSEADPFSRPAPREGDALPLPELPPDEDSLFRRRETDRPSGLERPGTAPDPFAPAPTPDLTAPGARSGAALEPPPTLAPPSVQPGTPAARNGDPRDDAMRRTSRLAPRRGLFTGLWNRASR